MTENVSSFVFFFFLEKLDWMSCRKRKMDVIQKALQL